MKRELNRRFGVRERERLSKLFRQLGTDNPHEAEAARSLINNLLRDFDKTWADLIEVFGAVAIRADLANDILRLGSNDPNERANARRKIDGLLACHRKSWNDLANVLCANSYETWACNPLAGDDEDRVNPLDLVHNLIDQ
jgi:hypothetical protein